MSEELTHWVAAILANMLLVIVIWPPAARVLYRVEQAERDRSAFWTVFALVAIGLFCTSVGWSMIMRHMLIWLGVGS